MANIQFGSKPEVVNCDDVYFFTAQWKTFRGGHWRLMLLAAAQLSQQIPAEASYMISMDNFALVSLRQALGHSAPHEALYLSLNGIMTLTVGTAYW